MLTVALFLPVGNSEYEIAQLVCSVLGRGCLEGAGRRLASILLTVRRGAGKLGDEQRAAVAAADGCAESLAGAD